MSNNFLVKHNFKEGKALYIENNALNIGNTSYPQSVKWWERVVMWVKEAPKDYCLKRVIQSVDREFQEVKLAELDGNQLKQVKDNLEYLIRKGRKHNNRLLTKVWGGFRCDLRQLEADVSAIQEKLAPQAREKLGIQNVSTLCKSLAYCESEAEIFEKQADKQKEDELVVALSKREMKYVIDAFDVHVRASVLKSLISALTPFESVRDDFLKAGNKHALEQDRRDSLQRAISGLPDEDRRILKEFFRLLNLVAENGDNAMDADRLGSCFGPSMLKRLDDPATSNAATVFLIKNYRKISWR